MEVETREHLFWVSFQQKMFLLIYYYIRKVLNVQCGNKTYEQIVTGRLSHQSPLHWRMRDLASLGNEVA